MLAALAPAARADGGIVVVGHDRFFLSEATVDTGVSEITPAPPIIPLPRSGPDSETLSSPEKVGPAWPVIIDNDTLYMVYENLGPFTAQDRVLKIRQQLEILINNPHYLNIPITLRESTGRTEIVCDDIVIATVTNGDARIAGGLRQEIASDRARLMQQIVERERARRNPRSLILGLLFGAIATICLIVLWRLITMFAYRLKDRLTGRHVLMFGPLSGRTATENRHADQIIASVKTVRIVIQLALIYAYVTLVTSFFYTTQGLHISLNRQLRSLALWAEPRFVGFLPQLMILATIATVTYIALQLIRLLFVGLSRGTLRWPGFRPEWSQPAYRLTSFLFMIIALVAAWPHLPGAGSPVFTGIAIFIGVLFALGSVALAANGIAGIVLGFSAPFKVGDRVRVAGTTGDVIGWTLLATRLRTDKNVEVTIPSALVLANHIVNFSRPGDRRRPVLATQVTLGHEVPWSQAHDLLLRAARQTPHVLTDPPPFVIQKKLEQDSVTYELNVCIQNPSESLQVYSLVHQNIQDVFKEAGVAWRGAEPSPEGLFVPRDVTEEYLPHQSSVRHFHVFPPLRKALRHERPLPPGEENIPE